MKNMHQAFEPRKWSLAHHKTLQLGASSILMGILNVTPDSFSDGCVNLSNHSVLSTAKEMLAQNAHILDVGGESTRPGATAVDADVEQARVLPVIERLAADTAALISIDSYRANTAEQALKAGAHIINDIWGLQKDRDMAKVAADYGAGVCIMHNGRDRAQADDIIEDQLAWFGRSIDIAIGAGIHDDQIMLDPGFGFAKDERQNIELMARFSELLDLGFPLMVGTSRKRFIGALTRKDVDQRDVGTAATSAYLRLHGASLFRVHDVDKNADALAIIDATIAHHNFAH